MTKSTATHNELSDPFLIGLNARIVYFSSSSPSIAIPTSCSEILNNLLVLEKGLFKNDHFRPLFRYFRLFYAVHSKQMFNLNFADDWIRAAGLWCWKLLLYQLSHCPRKGQILAQRSFLSNANNCWPLMTLSMADVHKTSLPNRIIPV